MKEEVDKKRNEGRIGKKQNEGRSGRRKRMKRIEAKYNYTIVPPWLKAVRVKY